MSIAVWGWATAYYAKYVSALTVDVGLGLKYPFTGCSTNRSNPDSSQGTHLHLPAHRPNLYLGSPKEV